jgi:hypothetical protein
VDDRKNALLVQPTEKDLADITLATVQHALLRGIEVRFQLEEGEILAEPMPTRSDRNGFLLYEATEGGAGVLSRLVEEPGILAEVALLALRVMHFELSGEGGLPSPGTALTDAPDTRCVAACYRCLMSYFNQPDHELLDRRDAKARELLLRLAQSVTTLSFRESPPLTAGGAPERPTSSKGLGLDAWITASTARGLPPPDAAPLKADGVEVPLVWRDHYVAAWLGAPDLAAAARLADLGFELISFDGPESTWADSFTRLSRALGRT